MTAENLAVGPVTERDVLGVGRPVTPLSDADIAVGALTRLRTVVTAQPDAVAVVDAERSYTFAELAGRAAAVAQAVREAFGEPVELPEPSGPPAGRGAAGEAESAPSTAPSSSPSEGSWAEPVAMLSGHHGIAVATLYGVVLSGHPLLVLDPWTPPARLAGFLRRVGARYVLADEANAEVARQVVAETGGRVLPTPAATAPPAGTASRLWSRLPDPTAPAFLGFTSGSTGNPKVVAIDHRLIVAHCWVDNAATDCCGADDVMAHTLPMAFNAGTLATLAGPLVGTTMALYDVRGRGIAGLPAWIHEVGATVVHASPAILRALVESRPRPELLAGLRSLTVAGEAAYGRDIDAARGLLPSTCTVFNRYGSSETSLIAEFRLRPGEPTPEGTLPAGTPVGHTVVTLIDEDGNPVPPGEPGIVTVTRDHLAIGYWRDPERTAAAYRDNPDGTRTYRSSDLGRFDEQGRLTLLGRRDHSVKIRGYMVEPGEVDAALFALPEVREAVVVGRPRPGDGRLQLVAYLVPAVEQLSPAAVRAALRASLPAYMVPESIVLLGALPRTERGKIDRSALPEPPAGRLGSQGQAFSAWERLVADVWSRVLGIDDIGLDDDFFALGGDSLAAEALVSAMVADLGVSPTDATTSVLVQAPTVREFAQRLIRRPDTDDVLVPIRTTGSRTPLFIVAGGGGLGIAFLPLARHLDDDQPVFALQAHGMERRGVPDYSVRAIARRNLAAVRSVQPRGPYHLAGHSFGGLVVLEMAHQLRRAGAEVGQLVILDSFPPDPHLHLDRPPQPIKERAREAVGVALTGVRGTPGSDQYWRFHRLSEWLHRRYRCAPWAGDTVVVVADSPEKEQRARWEPHLTGDWQLVHVRGDHLSMIREPYVGETAAVVADALAAWRSRYGR